MNTVYSYPTHPILKLLLDLCPHVILLPSSFLLLLPPPLLLTLSFLLHNALRVQLVLSGCSWIKGQQLEHGQPTDGPHDWSKEWRSLGPVTALGGREVGCFSSATLENVHASYRSSVQIVSYRYLIQPCVSLSLSKQLFNFIKVHLLTSIFLHSKRFSIVMEESLSSFSHKPWFW